MDGGQELEHDVDGADEQKNQRDDVPDEGAMQVQHRNQHVDGASAKEGEERRRIGEELWRDAEFQVPNEDSDSNDEKPLEEVVKSGEKLSQSAGDL